jgi:hypothetical protein
MRKQRLDTCHCVRYCPFDWAANPLTAIRSRSQGWQVAIGQSRPSKPPPRFRTIFWVESLMIRPERCGCASIQVDVVGYRIAARSLEIVGFEPSQQIMSWKHQFPDRRWDCTCSWVYAEY